MSLPACFYGNNFPSIFSPHSVFWLFTSSTNSNPPFSKHSFWEGCLLLFSIHPRISQGWWGIWNHSCPREIRMKATGQDNLHRLFGAFSFSVQPTRLKISPNYVLERFGCFHPLWITMGTDIWSNFHPSHLLPPSLGSFTHLIKGITWVKSSGFRAPHHAPALGQNNPLPSWTRSQKLTSGLKFGHNASINTPSLWQAPHRKRWGLHHSPSETIPQHNGLRTSFS